MGWMKTEPYTGRQTYYSYKQTFAPYLLGAAAVGGLGLALWANRYTVPEEIAGEVADSHGLPITLYIDRTYYAKIKVHNPTRERIRYLVRVAVSAYPSVYPERCNPANIDSWGGNTKIMIEGGFTKTASVLLGFNHFKRFWEPGYGGDTWVVVQLLEDASQTEIFEGVVGSLVYVYRPV